jgi:tetrapyrrole methylase family protein/MazG family protein
VGGRIIIVGLGPGDPKYLTREAWEVLSNSEEVYLRTGEHPAAEFLAQHVHVHTFDVFYEEGRDFSATYDAIVKRVLQIASEASRVVYAVPGDPMVGEKTVSTLCERASEIGAEVVIVSGVSFAEPCLALLGLDALDGLCIVDALQFADEHHPPFPPDIPALVAQLYSRLVASNVKLNLMSQYPDDHPVKLLHRVGTEASEVEVLPLYEVDRSDKIGSMTSLFIPPLAIPSSLERFQETIARLRAPDGCPWDRKQTHKSLRAHLMQECYETLQAIDLGDLRALQEELGDLLLQIVLQTQIATEEGEFNMADVIAGINEKIIRRHPHVFGETHVAGVEQVLQNWEALKADERHSQGVEKGIMDGVPLGLPALAQANEMQMRAARVGFDWHQVEAVIDKVREEMREVLEAQEQAEKIAEIGDLLFAVVNYSRWLGIDPEAALREANRRFHSRFSRLESVVHVQGRKVNEMTLEELDRIWEAMKGEE